ncbi:MAG TPA: ABC transporter substrate-binding protein [Desulfobacterales bacterium]|nr:ABC transporter substrate-binding protein [Desulfobacterales bacterium]
MIHPGRSLRTVALLVLFAGSTAIAGVAAPATFALALDGPVTGAHGPWLHASASGAFSAAGLAVTMRYPAGRGAALEALVGGSVDACVADAAAILAARASGAKLTIVASVGDLHPALVVSPTGSAITSPTDLVGKRIAIDPLDPDRLVFPVYLAGAGLRLDDIVVVALDRAGGDAALAAGTVDAAIDRFDGDRPGFATLPWAEDGFLLYGPCIAVRDETLRARGTAVRSFLKAILATWDTCLDDPGAAAGLAASTGLVSAADVEDWLAAELWRFDTQTYREKGLGWLDRARMASTLEAVRAMLGQPVSFAAVDAFTTAYLPVPAVLRTADEAPSEQPATPSLKR